MSSDPAKKNRASQIRPFMRKNAKPSQPIRLSALSHGFCSSFFIIRHVQNSGNLRNHPWVHLISFKHTGAEIKKAAFADSLL
jgi:hypothetical protein